MPEQCHHPLASMKPRGNRNQKWWTCLQCQARLERKSIDHDAEITPNDLMNFGTYATMTYEEVVIHHPVYCGWVTNTMELESEVSPQLARFAQYLIMREEPEPTIEGAIPMNALSDSAAPSTPEKALDQP